MDYDYCSCDDRATNERAASEMLTSGISASNCVPGWYSTYQYEYGVILSPSSPDNCASYR